MVLMPILLEKSKAKHEKAVTMTQSIAIVCYLILFFVGKSIPALYVLTFIACMFSTMTNVFRPMTAWKFIRLCMAETTADQLNGTISAIGGFLLCGTAISNAILAGVLAATGYIANATGQEPKP